MLQGVSSRDSGGFSWNNQVMNFSPSDKDSSLQRQIAEIVVIRAVRRANFSNFQLARANPDTRMFTLSEPPHVKIAKLLLLGTPVVPFFLFLFGGSPY